MRTGRTILLCSLIVSTVLVSTPSHADEIFGVNIIRNPGAEEGTADWTTSGGGQVVPYTRSGTPSCLFSGNNYFAGFASPGVGAFLEQTIDVSPGAATIDRGGVAVRMIGTFGSISSGTAYLSAEYFAGNGWYHGSDAAPGLQSGCHGSLGTNAFHEDIVPIGTRTIRVRLYLQEGSWADDLSMTLLPPPFADLATRASSSSEWAVAKVPFKHTFTVQNLGPDTATHAFLFVRPPAGAMVMSSPGCYASVVPADPAEPSMYTCEIGSLVVGKSKNATFTFTLRAFKKGTYTSNAFSYDEDDRNGANDTATPTTSIGGKYVETATS